MALAIPHTYLEQARYLKVTRDTGQSVVSGLLQPCYTVSCEIAQGSTCIEALAVC